VNDSPERNDATIRERQSLAVPDQFSADWNESKLAALLTSLAPVALGIPC
jgi:hypothetical protein